MCLLAGCVHVTHPAGVRPGWFAEAALGPAHEDLQEHSWSPEDQPSSADVWDFQINLGRGWRFSPNSGLMAEVLVPLSAHDATLLGSLAATSLDLYWQFLGRPVDVGAGAVVGVNGGVYLEVGKTVALGPARQIDLALGAMAIGGYDMGLPEPGGPLREFAVFKLPGGPPERRHLGRPRELSRALGPLRRELRLRRLPRGPVGRGRGGGMEVPVGGYLRAEGGGILRGGGDLDWRGDPLGRALRQPDRRAGGQSALDHSGVLHLHYPDPGSRIHYAGGAGGAGGHDHRHRFHAALRPGGTDQPGGRDRSLADRVVRYGLRRQSRWGCPAGRWAAFCALGRVPWCSR